MRVRAASAGPRGHRLPGHRGPCRPERQWPCQPLASIISIKANPRDRPVFLSSINLTCKQFQLARRRRGLTPPMSSNPGCQRRCSSQDLLASFEGTLKTASALTIAVWRAARIRRSPLAALGYGLQRRTYCFSVALSRRGRVKWMSTGTPIDRSATCFFCRPNLSRRPHVRFREPYLSLARETWRWWRFNSLLFIGLLAGPSHRRSGVDLIHSAADHGFRREH
jgi:hypothetical protein